MRKKSFIVGIIFLVVSINFLFMVSAAMSINISTPASNSSNLSTATQYLNASLLGVDGNSMAGNVTFYYQPWLYQNNGSWIKITTVQNTTGNQSTFNATWDTTAVADGKNYTLNATVQNLQNVSNGTAIRGNITIDNTPPVLAVYSGATLTAYANTSIKTNRTLTGSIFPNNLTLNISITDATVGLLNSSNVFCFINLGGGANSTVPLLAGRWCNTSDLNITGFSTDGNKTVNIYINDTSNNMRLNDSLVVHIDATAPSPTATCSPTTVQTGDSFPCACSTSDATSGINSGSSGGTSTSPDGVATPSSTGTFVFTCSAVDNGGLTATATKTYVVLQSTGGGSSSGSGSGSAGTPKPNSQVYSFTKVTPGAASIAKYVDASLGIKQIEITVNNEAQSVKVTVTKYDGKPAQVSVAKTGKVYQYMQINASNLENKLDKAKITAKVNKSWVMSNDVDKNNIVISKFDESNSKWNELPTSFSSEDDTYYYYEAEVGSFSFFSISERAVVADSGSGSNDGTTDSATGSSDEGRSWTWLWIVIAIAVVAVLWSVVKGKKKSRY